MVEISRYPLESLEHNQFTIKSDVWSYAVTVWEVFSRGVQPYNGFQYKQVFDYLKSGMRLEKPRKCSEQIYELLVRCWSYKAKSRPTFIEITEFFSWYTENRETKASRIHFQSRGVLI